MKVRILFLGAAIILILGGLYYRAHNASTAKAQTAQIENLDTANDDTTTAIANLKAFVNGHMGASATFTLSAAYGRAQTAAQSAAAIAAANARVYAAAQAACSGRTDSITQAQCNQNYITKHIVAEPAGQSTAAPVLANYQYSLRAPFWTPDLAGALFLGAAAALALAIFYRPRRRY